MAEREDYDERAAWLLIKRAIAELENCLLERGQQDQAEHDRACYGEGNGQLP